MSGRAPSRSGVRRANSAIEKCGVPSETALSGAPSATLESERAASRKSSAVSCKRSCGVKPPKAVSRTWSFGRAARDMKQRHRARRSGGGAQCLQVILANAGGQADDRRNEPPKTAPDRRADRNRKPLGIPIFRNGEDLDQRPRGAIFGQVQAVCGGAAGHGAAEVDEIAIAIGARADHRIGEGDRVRFSPGDLRAEARTPGGLIRRAGKGGRAAELDMRPHESGAVLRMLLCSAKELGMNQVDRADVEGCRHANPAAEFDHPFGEVEARAPMVKTAVDMRSLDVDEGARVDR